MIWYIKVHCLTFTSITSKLNLIVPVLKKSTMLSQKKTVQNKTKAVYLLHCISFTRFALSYLSPDQMCALSSKW